MRYRLPMLFRRQSNPLMYLLMWVPYVSIYQLTNRFPMVQPRELPYGAADQLIPYVPELMPLYLMYFPLYWWTAIRSESDEVAVRLFYAAYLQLAVCAVIFVLFPVRMPEHVLAHAAAGGWSTTFWKWFDGPNNCLPSLHAANGLLLMHFNWNRPARWPHSLLALGIVISTVFVKQHYLIDVLAGAGVYLLSAAFLARLDIGAANESLRGKRRAAGPATVLPSRVEA